MRKEIQQAFESEKGYKSNSSGYIFLQDGYWIQITGKLYYKALSEWLDEHKKVPIETARKMINTAFYLEDIDATISRDKTMEAWQEQNLVEEVK